MGLNDIATITISRSSPGVTKAGFDTMLIATDRPTWTEHARSYTSLTGVASDFATTTPEYAAAENAFAQTPQPKKVMFGRLEHKSTKIQTITIKSVKDSTNYRVNVWCNGTVQTATYPSGTGATNDTIATGVAAAITALAAPDIGATAAATGSSSSKIVTCTADSAGNYFDLEVMAEATDTQVSALMDLTETTVDPSTTLAADLDAIQADSDPFYGLCLIAKGALVGVAAGWAQSNGKLFGVSSSDTQIATVNISTAEDVMEELLDNSRSRSAPAYHPRNYEFFDVAQMARFFGIAAGGDNWRMKTLSGVTPVVFTDTQITNMEAKYCNYYYTLGGVNVVGGKGKVSSGEYIDVIRGLDAYTADVQEGLVDLELNNEKIPFTDEGIALIEALLRQKNKKWIKAKLIAASPAPTITVPLAADVDSDDKAARDLTGVSTSWTLAGAINKVAVTVYVAP
jgi:hypothetical protein